MFILLINTSAVQMNDITILHEYKEQISVKKCFKVKDIPTYLIDELFVKILECFETLEHVMLMSLIVLNLLEHNVRKGVRFYHACSRMYMVISYEENHRLKCVTVGIKTRYNNKYFKIITIYL